MALSVFICVVLLSNKINEKICMIMYDYDYYVWSTDRNGVQSLESEHVLCF